MSEELKPVHCGCGGEAEIIKHPNGKYTVSCTRGGCMANVGWCPDEKTAIKAWNRAMSGSAEEKLKAFWDGMSAEMKEERTAKATPYEKDSKGYWATDGRCEGCGCYLERKYNYCPLCGARLEWE